MTHYDVLDLPPGSTVEVIRGRYRELARAMHPDLGGDPQAFAAVTEAHAVLTDVVRRLDYDAKLALLMDSCPACGGKGLHTVQLSFTQTTTRRCSACQGRGYHERH